MHQFYFILSSYLTRIIYSVYFNNYADQNDLFTFKPSEPIIQSNLLSYNVSNCDPNSCLPVLFYDFYTKNNLTLNQAKNLVFGIKQAWFEQNSKLSQDFYRSILNLNIYSVIAYGPTNLG